MDFYKLNVDYYLYLEKILSFNKFSKLNIKQFLLKIYIKNLTVMFLLQS